MFQTHNNCLICNSTRLIELPKYKNDYLVQCTDCSFVFCKRIPTQQELIEHYKTYHRGNDISPITVQRYNDLLNEFEKFRKNNTILDIGCGDGHFLSAAQKRGWNVYGTEFSDEAITILKSKNINIHHGVLNANNYSSDMFDVITSFEVIEHINNPNAELSNILKILRKGGLVYITTPNFNSISRYYLKHWNIIEYPEHLSYYSQKTLTFLFQKNNFKKTRINTTGIDINRLRAGNSGSNSNQKNDLQEELREKTESNILYRLIKNIINSTLNIFKIGDTIKGYYQKQ